MTVKRLFIVFLCGIFFMGVGAGIGFWEYSSFAFRGEKDLATSGPLNSETFDFEFDATSEELIFTIDDTETSVQIIPDPSMADDEAIVTVSYPSPYVYISTNMDEPAEYTRGRHTFYIYTNYTQSLFFNNMEMILEDIKAKEVYEYTPPSIESVTITVSPQTAMKLSIR